MKSLQIEVFLCRSDNFGVLLHCPETGETATIDAPEFDPIVKAAEKRGWKITHIFTTHHHGDHVEANLALKEKYGCEIIGPRDEAAAIPGINMPVFCLMMCTSLGVMGIITPYGTGPSPIYYGSGYLPTKDYWRLGTIFGAIFLAALLLIGYPWITMMF